MAVCPSLLPAIARHLYKGQRSPSPSLKSFTVEILFHSCPLLRSTIVASRSGAHDIVDFNAVLRRPVAEDGNSQRHRVCVGWSLRAGQLRIGIGLGLLMVSGVGSSWAQFAIPERYHGFVNNGVPEQGRGPVVWEVFIDPLCLNCKSGWPTVTQVMERYGSFLVLVVHPFPALFHRNAFFAARALHIAQMMNTSLVYPLLELIFGNQETFSNPSTKYETPAHVISRLISLTGELGISCKCIRSWLQRRCHR